MENYNHQQIEEKWRKIWQETELYKTSDNDDKKKCYVLDMFPYPSGAGLHVGHPKGYIATDVVARMKILQGYNVLHPMGWDAFGLPTENFAIKNKVHPRAATEKNIATFKAQLEKLGFTYDWSREINTTDPEFYKWTQWIFLEMFKRGLAYESYEPIIWCPSCQTALAMEDLENGKCERCGSEVERKPMRQWVLKITAYAERLLNDLEKLPQWEEAIKEMQRNWIGKSVGATINFKIISKNESFSAQNGLSKESQHFSRNSAELTRNYAEIKDTESKLLYKDLTYNIRGALFNVKKKVGLGHKESVYHNALKIEFEKQGLAFESEKQIDVQYEGKNIGVYQPDFIIENKVLIELKALPKIGRQQLNQTWTYLKGSDFKVALLVNYGGSELEIKRMIYDTARIDNPNNSAFSASIPQNSATSLEVFTTRPDTLFGCTYMVIAPEHPLIENRKSEIENYEEVRKYFEQSKKKSDLERTDLAKEKTGVKIEGLVAVNPVNNEEIPIFVADYVLAGYGTGAIMAVPAHDSRDYEFAGKYNIEIKPVVKAETAKYVIIEKSLPAEAESELRKFGDVKIEKEDKNWGKFYNVFVDDKNESKLIDFLMKNLLTESDDGGAWYADSMGTTNIAVFPNKKIEINNSDDLNKFKEYGRSVGIQEEQLNIEFNVFTGEGININSDFLNGLKTKEAKQKIVEWLEEKGVGKRAVNYKLRDWVFSRQRYWGEPIPLIYCEHCKEIIKRNKSVWKLEIGNWKLIKNYKLKIENLEFSKGELLNPGWIADNNLPLKLPAVEHYEPSGTGESPLANMPEWVNVKCPKCGGPAKRETNTMPQWAGSSWYYLRYIDPRNDKALADKEKEKYWSPVDLYVGGAEHATRHLIYARFWHKFLYDIGVVNYDEPFTRLRHVGLILAEDGRKMSKRWGNVINPDEVVDKYGADAMRVYEMFMGPFSQPVAWSTSGLKGARNFLEKVWRLQAQIDTNLKTDLHKLNSLTHKTIKKVGEDIEEFKFNTAISAMMILVNEMSGLEKISPENYEALLKILSPFAPHITEELWEDLHSVSIAPAEVGDYGAGEDSTDKDKKCEQSIFKQEWPQYDLDLIKDETINLVVQINGKVRDSLEVAADISDEDAKKLALASEKIKKWIKGKEVAKVIYVKGKLVNIVVK